MLNPTDKQVRVLRNQRMTNKNRQKIWVLQKSNISSVVPMIIGNVREKSLFSTYSEQLIDFTFKQFNDWYTPSRAKVKSFVKEYIQECVEYNTPESELFDNFFDSELFNDWFLD